MRGTPAGRQFVSGSSFDWRDFRIFSAEGSNGSFSPLGRPGEMLPVGPPPYQTPERSSVPSARWGVGPVGLGGSALRTPGSEFAPCCWAAADAAISRAKMIGFIGAAHHRRREQPRTG